MTAALTREQVLARAQSLLLDHKLDEAEQLYLLVLNRDARDAGALAGMAHLYARQGKMDWAVNSAVRAIREDPDNLDVKRLFLRLAGGRLYKRYNPEIEAAVISCLDTADVDFGKAALLWVSALLTSPFFRQLYERILWRGYLRDRFFPWMSNPFDGVKDFRPLRYPLFLLGLRRAFVADLAFERFMVLLRQFLLRQSLNKSRKIPPQDFHELVISVAHYCHQTDYIFETSDAEARIIDGVRQRVEADAAPSAIDVALLGCYMPLVQAGSARRLLTLFDDDPSLRELLARQIGDALDLKARAQLLASTDGAANDVSAHVQEQYEHFPYPRWREFGAGESIWSKDQADLLAKPGSSVLIAGCGTGLESCDLAASFPNATILAIDLTPTSLAYAAERTEAYGLRNITYKHADILRLGGLGMSFDYIQSFGVLHHMKEPEKGWRILVDLLKPGGLMFIGLYSRHARFAVKEAQGLIEAGAFPPTAEGMRRFRKASRKLLSRRSFNFLARGVDYYSLAMYRDLLFHVHEDCFDIPRIAADLKELGLTFLSWRLSADVFDAYRKAYPDDRTGTDLSLWDAFEKQNPETFKNCYAFMCRKSA